MTQPRDDVPLADLDEQQRAIDAEEEDLEEGGEVPQLAPHTVDAEANEADVLEQALPVRETEDYPYGPAEDEEG